MKTLFIGIIFIVSGSVLFAQQRTDATIEKRNNYLMAHPEYALKMQKMKLQVDQYLSQRGLLKTTASDEVITIPVVFHVVYNTVAQNITNQQVLSQLEVLNEDFRRLNADTVNTPTIYAGVAADCKVEFCLATRDPQGKSTSGIERKATTKTSFNYLNDDVKFDSKGGLDAWDSDYYLNIWICNLGSEILGYGQFPGMDKATDGVVIHYKYFGRDGSAVAPFDGGRTCTHEVGHWLGLEHTWGDGGCSVDDDIADTPTCKNSYESSESKGCPSPGDQCGDGRRMIENYMDYSQDACFNIFTQGQADKILAIINTQRKKLLSSTGCRVFDAKPLVNFDADKKTVYQGGKVTFESLVNDADTLYWLFEGADSVTSSLTKPTLTYLNAGIHNVTLIAKNNIGDSVLLKPGFIEVLPTTESTTFTSFYTGDNILETTTQGYKSGHNSFKDKGKANYYDSPQPYVAIEGIKYVFGHVQYNDPQATITAVLWESVGGAPGKELFTKNIKISELSVDDTLTVLFPEPIEMLWPYFAGIKLNYKSMEIVQNSVALYMTRDGQVVPGRAWEQLTSDKWVPFTEPDLSWGKEVVLSIYPMLKMLKPEIDFEAEKTQFYTNEQVVIHNRSHYAYDYSWGIEEAEITGIVDDVSPVVLYDASGTFDVRLIGSNFLYSEEEYKIDYLEVEEGTVGGITDFNASSKVYPNPFEKEVHIASEEPIQQLICYDLLGRVLLEKNNLGLEATLNLEYLKGQVFILEIIGFSGKNRILLYKH